MIFIDRLLTPAQSPSVDIYQAPAFERSPNNNHSTPNLAINFSDSSFPFLTPAKPEQSGYNHGRAPANSGFDTEPGTGGSKLPPFQRVPSFRPTLVGATSFEWGMHDSVELGSFGNSPAPNMMDYLGTGSPRLGLSGYAGGSGMDIDPEWMGSDPLNVSGLSRGPSPFNPPSLVASHTDTSSGSFTDSLVQTPDQEIRPDPWTYRPIPLYAGQDIQAWGKEAGMYGGLYSPDGFDFTPASRLASTPFPSPSFPGLNLDASNQALSSEPLNLANYPSSDMYGQVRQSGASGEYHPQFGEMAQYSTVGSIEDVMALCRDGALEQLQQQASRQQEHQRQLFHRQHQSLALGQGSSGTMGAQHQQQHQVECDQQQYRYRGSIDPAMLGGKDQSASGRTTARGSTEAEVSSVMSGGGSFGADYLGIMRMGTGSIDPIPGVNSVIANDMQSFSGIAQSGSQGYKQQSSSSGNEPWSPYSPHVDEPLSMVGDGVEDVSSSGWHVAGSSTVNGRRASIVQRKEKGAKASKGRVTTSKSKRRQSAASSSSEQHAQLLKQKAMEAIDALQLSQNQQTAASAVGSASSSTPLKIEAVSPTADQEMVGGEEIEDGEPEGSGDGDDTVLAGQADKVDEDGEGEEVIGVGGKKTKLKRKEMNRVAARRHREKTKEKLRGLEDRKVSLEHTIIEYEGSLKKMQDTLFRMQKENEMLRRANFQHNMASSGAMSHSLPTPSSHPGGAGP